jgi:hypothetical protein
MRRGKSHATCVAIVAIFVEDERSICSYSDVYAIFKLHWMLYVVAFVFSYSFKYSAAVVVLSHPLSKPQCFTRLDL